VKINIKALYQTEGYRVEKINTDGERAQVELLWDDRFKPRCSQCGHTMRINRKVRQSATDLPLASAGYVGLLYEAVQGYCRHCAGYETIRPLEIVEQHQATLRLMRQVSLLCRWLPLQRICEILPVTPSTAYRWDRYILQTELPEPRFDGLEAMPTKALTKSALLLEIGTETDTDRKTAAFFLEVITDIALREVKKDGEFTFPGIGKLVKQKRKARIGRNPKTGEKIKIAAKTVVKFRVSKSVKDLVLGGK
jgi:DNA-binding protein HU-beta